MIKNRPVAPAELKQNWNQRGAPATSKGRRRAPVGRPDVGGVLVAANMTATVVDGKLVNPKKWSLINDRMPRRRRAPQFSKTQLSQVSVRSHAFEAPRSSSTDTNVYINSP
jgi:hypothetical protein